MVSRDQYYERISKGECVDCQVEHDGGTARCEECSEAYNRKQREARKKPKLKPAPLFDKICNN